MDWSSCGLLWCLFSCLDSHSDGTHSLLSIHWWGSDAVLHFSKSDEETKSSTSWIDFGIIIHDVLYSRNCISVAVNFKAVCLYDALVSVFILDGFISSLVQNSHKSLQMPYCVLKHTAMLWCQAAELVSEQEVGREISKVNHPRASVSVSVSVCVCVCVCSCASSTRLLCVM